MSTETEMEESPPALYSDITATIYRNGPLGNKSKSHNTNQEPMESNPESHPSIKGRLGGGVGEKKHTKGCRYRVPPCTCPNKIPRDAVGLAGVCLTPHLSWSTLGCSIGRCLSPTGTGVMLSFRGTFFCDLARPTLGIALGVSKTLKVLGGGAVI